MNFTYFAIFRVIDIEAVLIEAVLIEAVIIKHLIEAVVATPNK